MNAEDILRSVLPAFAPPTQLTVSQFSDEEIILTTGPLAGTKWQTSFAPYQRAILDAFHEPGIEIVVVMGSAQWGKTACAVNVVAFHILHDPSPILVVEPTVDPMAKDFARNRLNPVIEASPALRDAVAKVRSRDSANTVLAKTFRGGDIAIGGANSAASLAARSRRLLVLDEIDRYPPELPGEGNTIAVAFKRTLAYRRRRRILMLSSPTVTGAPIDAWFHRGDQRRYFVPCPMCEHMHALQWANIRRVEDGVSTAFKKDGRDPDLARFVCPACGAAFGDAERIAILARGEWRPDHPERGDRTIASFHLWEGYSPLSSIGEIVRGFLRARAAQLEGDKTEMHTWQNTTLGEPVEPDEGEGVEPHVLLVRREHYGAGVDVPARVGALTMGVDIQDDRIEALVIGWGIGEESWLIDRLNFPGDTSRIEPWRMLEHHLDTAYRHALGVTIGIEATGVDTAGHRTTEAYDFCHRLAARRVFACIGRDGQRPIVSSPSPRKWGRGQRQVPLYTVGVDASKALLMSRLSITESGAGYVHIPHAEWSDDELAEQLTAERLQRRYVKGRPVYVWRTVRARNEMLDAAILAHAALRLLNPRMEQWLDLLTARAKDSGTEPPPPPPPKRSPWISPRQGWLSRR